MAQYKLVYSEVNNDRTSKNFGYEIEQVKKFHSLNEAVEFSRMLANTNINMRGKPIIEEI